VTPLRFRHIAATWLIPDPTVERSEAAQFLSMTLGTLLAQNNHHRPDHQRSAAAMPDTRGG